MDLVKLSALGGFAFMATLAMVSTSRAIRAEPLRAELYPAATPESIQARIDDAFRTDQQPPAFALSGPNIPPLVAAPVLPIAASGPRFPFAGASVERWSALIDEAAQRFNIPAVWIRGVMQQESAGRTHRSGSPITSHAGAMGLMQVMPATFAELRARYGLGPDPHDPRTNIMAGAAYLREMYDRYGPRYFLAAYNAGPARVDEHLRTGRPLPYETRNYTASLMPTLVPNAVPLSTPMSAGVQDLTSVAALRAAASAPSRPADRRAVDPSSAPVFAASATPVPTATSHAADQPRDSLFVTLSAVDRRRSAASGGGAGD
ncbi:lytic transglycosylase domain-containing protein [Sphingomonas sp. CCH5-D11]|jgi:soluble lytic murein transglycosylase-like protein|uniref:lytic transglycosylase domain-containing protein n=1 Tax=Sphingomonas sp. CCH5-D11 TaxID=1768786 RepID=UPI00082B31D7|nr:lytic transglycosylase domain-containing protein [Sphingomonas sp. CCH5-D11]